MAWWFLLILSALAGAAAVTAIVLALRAERCARAARRASEGASRPHPRPFAPAGGLAGIGAQADQLQASLDQQGRRLQDLESLAADLTRQVRARPRPDPVDRTSDEARLPSPESRIRQHLASHGYEEPVLLERPDRPGVWTLEARRRGLWAKGAARLLEDGRLEIRLEPVTRAFP